MTKPIQLRIVSYLAPNLFWYYKAVGAYLSRKMHVETEIVQSQFDPLDDPALRNDRLDMAFICGLPFARYQRIVAAQLEVLVAPVMAGGRYQNRPIYFADIIVNAASNLQNFDDLLGRKFCYNDRGSHSGYNLLRDRLIQQEYTKGFFQTVSQSGSHQASIQAVVNGLVDCAAIDSTVLEQALRDRPELDEYLRVITSIGPSPMPPVVASRRLGADLLELLRQTLLTPDAELQAAMQEAGIRGYTVVDAYDYDAIATMYDAALQAGYMTIH